MAPRTIKRIASQRRPRPTRAASALLGMVMVVGGCSSSHGPDNATAPLTKRYQTNQAQWSLPLDTYEPSQRLIYALNLLTSSCMRSKGVVWRPPPEIPQSENRNTAGRKLFNLALASRLGYRGARPGSKPPATGWDGTTHTATEDREVGECLQANNRVFGNDSGIPLNESLGSAAYDEAKADMGTIHRAQAWLTCMRPLGISDLSTPWSVPTTSMRTRFGMDPDTTTGRPPVHPTASPAEIKVAVFDAKCRESTGFSDYFYETEFTKQIDLIAQNRDALSRLAQQVQAKNAKIQAIIAKNGG